MVRRKNARGDGYSKRPTTTLDLTADEVRREEANDDGSDAGGDKKSDAVSDVKSDAERRADGEVGGGEPDKAGDIVGGGNEGNGENGFTGPENFQPRQSGSRTALFLSLLCAAMLGGAAALLFSQFLPKLVVRDGGDQIAPLTQKITALEAELETLKGLNPQNELEEKLVRLEARVENFQSSKPELDGRLDGVEKTINDLALAAKGGKNQIASVAAIANRVNSIEARVASEISALKGEFRADLIKDMDRLAKSVVRPETLSQIEMTRNKAAALSSQLMEIESRSTARGNEFERRLGRVDQKIATLQDEGLTAERFQTKLRPLRAELAALSEKLEVLSKREALGHENARRSALALAFGNLKRQLDRGESFGGELMAVKNLSEPSVDFSQMEGLSSEGVPTDQALLEAFPALAVDALKKSREREATSSIDKLLNKARATFKYRRTGDVKGRDSEAILARMEYKYRQGHVEETLEEFKKLKGAEAAVIGPWANKVKIRLMIESEMHRLEDQLLKSLSPR